MKKIIKKLFTPFAVFAMALGIGVSLSAPKEVKGVKAATLTDAISAKGWGGLTSNSYTAVGTDVNGTAPTSGVNIAMQIINPSTGAVRGNKSGIENFSMRNTTEYPGYIRKISITVTGGTITTSTSRSVVSLGNTPFTGSYITTTGSFAATSIGTGKATAEWNFPAGTDFKYFKLHSLQTYGTALAAAADSIKIEYEPVQEFTFGELESIEVNSDAAKLSYVKGETFSSEGLIVTAVDTEGNTKSVDDFTTNLDGYVFTEDDLGEKQVVVSYTEGITATATYDVSVIEAVYFSKISNSDELYFGAEYVLVSEESTPEPSVMNTTHTTFFGREDATTGTVLHQENHQVMKLVISPEAGSYGFQFTNGDQAGKYLALTSDNNNLHVESSLSKNSSWNISFEEGDAVIKSVSFNTRTIQYNNSSPRFATYTSSQTAVQLYVNPDTINHELSASMLANEVMNGAGNLANGKCEATLDFLTNVYNRLGSTAKNIFDNSTDSAFVSARERLSYLESWVAQNSSANLTREAVNNSSNRNLVAVVSMGLIGLTSILGYFFINKKRSLG